MDPVIAGVACITATVALETQHITLCTHRRDAETSSYRELPLHSLQLVRVRRFAGRHRTVRSQTYLSVLLWGS